VWAQDVRRDRLGGQRRAARGGAGGVRGDPAGKGLACERRAGAGRKQRLVGLIAALGQPFAQDLGRRFGQRGDALLATLAGGAGVRAGA
jgi:hypothetical protein